MISYVLEVPDLIWTLQRLEFCTFSMRGSFYSPTFVVIIGVYLVYQKLLVYICCVQYPIYCNLVVFLMETKSCGLHPLLFPLSLGFLMYFTSNPIWKRSNPKLSYGRFIYLSHSGLKEDFSKLD